MKRAISLLCMAIAVAVAAIPESTAHARQGKGAGKDADHSADMAVFHYLLDHRDAIKRTVVKRADGVETVTESDNAQVTEKIREHLTAMEKRVKEGRPIHARDPLFAEVFRNYKKITMKVEKTPKGVKVLETSDDAYVVKLIQAHADVVSLFLKNGHAEVRKNHNPPEKN